MKFLIQGPRGGKLIRQHRSKTELDRDFWSRVKIAGAEECWNWTMGTNNGERSGVGAYGVVWMNGRGLKAHRYAFESRIRRLRKGELVCHKCDNPPCCNPRHLFAGSNSSNMQDCIKKGRANREHGEDRYNARLKEDDIRSIRAMYIPRVVGIDILAAQFRVSRSMIFAIVKRTRWTHV